jgi:hypothetical protein
MHEADFLVIALGADYDIEATPGLAEGGHEFYSVAGAEMLADLLPTFSAGSYVEFGSDRVGRVDIDFLTGPKPTGVFQQPSPALVSEKEEFGSSRFARWFGGSR